MTPPATPPPALPGADTLLYSLGHGDRTLGELVKLLAEAGIRTLVDVRAEPEPRRHAHFGMDVLRTRIEAAGMTYHWAGRQLGGQRASSGMGDRESPHTALTDPALRAYADYMLTPEFEHGCVMLLGLARTAPTAMLCVERDPGHCPRSLIADYLLLAGARVIHLVARGECREHVLRSEVRRESTHLIYDRILQ